MKILSDVKPTPEQLKLFAPDPQLMIVKGAAGSGKTTTCLLRLRIIAGRLITARQRAGNNNPLKVLVFSYNRTLRGYIQELAQAQKTFFGNASIQISTFHSWAHEILDIKHSPQKIICNGGREPFLSSAFASFSQANTFLESELEYVLGRFPYSELDEYIARERTGRGLAPRFDRTQRQKFLDTVVRPYFKYKKDNNLLDFPDLAYIVSTLKNPPQYDVVIVDEGQDFSANELRAITNVLSPDHRLTIVIDSAQKIYAKYFSWIETGIHVRPENVFTLTENHRNTKEIAEFIAPIIDGADLGGDFGAIPSPTACRRSGEKPTLLEGKYSNQLEWVIDNIINKVDLTKESVAFMHPKGWFRLVKSRLADIGINYVNLTGEASWPDDDTNVGLVTMHSSKGIEFDHVIIIGLNQELTPHGDDRGDLFLDHYRRLLAMSCGRARETLTIGYKKEEASSLVNYFDQKTYRKITL